MTSTWPPSVVVGEELPDRAAPSASESQSTSDRPVGLHLRRELVSDDGRVQRIAEDAARRPASR